ncbi:MAG: serine hydrolase domain-containing protein [Terriglobia bacterium]
MRSRFSYLAVFALLLCVIPSVAQTTAELPAETIETIEAAIAAEMARLKIPGLSLAIVVEGELRYANGFGMADVENSVRVTSTTVFRIASITKPMTATAVLQLAERGKLDLDAPIQTYCPTFPQKRWPVTARQLLGHLGGLRHYLNSAEARGTGHYFTVVDSLALFKDDWLLHEPGTKFSYTTYGYSVLGCAIEGASGMSYEDYMRENIFQPAGMSHTRTDDTYAIIANRARGYLRLDRWSYSQLPDAAKASAKIGELYNAQLHDTSMKVPGGGLVSTAADLARFAIAVQAGVLVQEETRKQMWTRQKTRDGEETGWGLGWILPREMAGEKPVRISGGQPGTSSALVILPEKRFAVAAIANVEGTDLYPLVVQLGKIYGHFPGTLED